MGLELQLHSRLVLEVEGWLESGLRLLAAAFIDPQLSELRIIGLNPFLLKVKFQ